MIFSLALVAFQAASPAGAEPSSAPLLRPPDEPRWWSTLQVRSSTTDPGKVTKPATFQVTDPSGDGNSTHAIDLGIALPIERSPHWSISPSVELHRQTATGKEQDSRFAGVSATYIPRSPLESFAPVFQGDARYARDQIKDSNGALGKVTATAIAQDYWMGFPGGHDNLQFMWQPLVGALFQSSNDANGAGDSGSVLRLVGTAEAALFPRGKELQKRLSLRAGVTYWRDVNQSGGFEDLEEDRRIYRLGAAFFFDPDSHYGIGFDYVRGEDPETALPDQEYVQASFKVNF